MDYLVYAHLQLAQDKEARAVVDEMIEVKGYNPNVRTGPYAVVASQARYVLERSDWKGALDCRCNRHSSHMSTQSHILRAHWGQLAPVIRIALPGISPNSLSCARNYSKLKTAIGRNRSISNGRSRLLGYCM